VDGIFTTITSQDMFGAIQFCQELNVPVVTVNSGAAFADQLGLPQHISMQDYDAGYAAGKAMINAGMKYGHSVNSQLVNDLSPRCNGFQDAINNATGSGASWRHGSFKFKCAYF
jgi:simple sugar transport system substrate-binding protein